jgi:hypothetical protein
MMTSHIPNCRNWISSQICLVKFIILPLFLIWILTITVSHYTTCHTRDCGGNNDTNKTMTLICKRFTNYTICLMDLFFYMWWLPIPTTLQISTWRIFLQQVTKLLELYKRALVAHPKTTTMKTPTIHTIMLAKYRTIHTNTTTSITTTRGRPAYITFAYNDSRQHFNPINMRSIMGIGNLQSLDNTSPMPRTPFLLIMPFVMPSTSSAT